MIVKSAEFIKSAAGKEGFILSSVPQIAVCGRSNVGKSSFINLLTNQSKLAKTSNTPGRTRLVNYFLINKEFYIVDLPGYGFASGSKREVEAWGKMIEDYISLGDVVKRYILLVDIRHLPTKDDLQFIGYLNYYRLPFSVIATKSDKLGKTQIKPALNAIAAELKIGIDNIFAISSQSGSGKELVLKLLDSALK